MHMKILSVVLCVFISHHTVRGNNLTKPIFPNHSSHNESTEDDNQTNASDLDLAVNDDPSVDSGSGDNVVRNLFPIEITGGSPVLVYSTVCNDGDNNPQTFNVPSQTRVESTRGQSSYKRVFVGKDASGSEIYTSSPKMEHAVSLAENIRVVGSGLEILKKRKAVQSKGRRLANSLCKRSTKHKRNSTKMNGKRSVSKRKDSGYSSECEASSMSLSRQMILNPELRFSYENYMFSHREALNMMSLNEREFLESMFHSDDLGRPGPSGMLMQPDALASQHVGAELSPSRPFFHQELNSEPPYSAPGYEFSSLVAQNCDGTEARIDDSLNHFVAAVNSLLTLVDGLDVYFGSARRLRANLFEQPQESFNILEEISSCLRIMIIFSRPMGVGRLETDSENRLIDIADSVMYVNEEIWCHIIDFRNNENRDDDRGLVEYLVAILREFRNEVITVIESAQHIMEYFQNLLNIV